MWCFQNFFKFVYTSVSVIPKNGIFLFLETINVISFVRDGESEKEENTKKKKYYVIFY